MWSLVCRSCSRLAAGNQVRNASDGPPLKKLYEKFQKDDGVPVYLKGGPQDRVLFGITCALIAYGLADGWYTLIKMALPKKK